MLEVVEQSSRWYMDIGIYAWSKVDEGEGIVRGLWHSIGQEIARNEL